MNTKWVLFLLLLTFSSRSMAEIFLLLDVNVKNKSGAINKESKGKIYAKLNANLKGEFDIKKQDLRATFVARKVTDKDNNHGDQIYIEGKIYSIESGKERLIGTPQLLAIVGEEALFESGKSKTEVDYTVKVKTATTPISF
ncbi:MAG: hypothetical protein HQK51_02405 [Oligoflexia bacterium]|nr:hypothetical protein [Oligoflexia bacterium]